MAVLTLAISGCGGLMDLRPEVLPHAYDHDRTLGYVVLHPVTDLRSFPAIADRQAVRAHGCLEGRDIQRTENGLFGQQTQWLREPQVLKRPVVETLEANLAGELQASGRFRLACFEKPQPPNAAPYELHLELETLDVQIVIEDGQDGLGATVGMIGAGFVPVPGADIAAMMLAAKLTATAQIDCELLATVRLTRGQREVFTRPLRCQLSDTGSAASEKKRLRSLLETAVSRLCHNAVAECVRHLDDNPGTP